MNKIIPQTILTEDGLLMLQLAIDDIAEESHAHENLYAHENFEHASRVIILDLCAEDSGITKTVIEN
jgi:hypothetical protein